MVIVDERNSEQGRLEAEEKYKDEIAELKAEIARVKSQESKA